MKALIIAAVVVITLAYWDITSKQGFYTRGLAAMFRSVMQGFGY